MPKDDWSAESCYRIANIYRSKNNNNPSSVDLWVNNCWQTMGDWLTQNPQVDKAQKDKMWNHICERPEGIPYQTLIGGYTFLEL